MSFVNKIKGWGQKSERPIRARSTATSPSPTTTARGAARPRTPPPTCRSPTSRPAAAFDAMPQHGDGATPPPSIISEAVPSEIADFTETRLQDATPAPRRSAPPCR